MCRKPEFGRLSELLVFRRLLGAASSVGGTGRPRAARTTRPSGSFPQVALPGRARRGPRSLRASPSGAAARSAPPPPPAPRAPRERPARRPPRSARRFAEPRRSFCERSPSVTRHSLARALWEEPAGGSRVPGLPRAREWICSEWGHC
nr:uncharacterized protein LOC111757664 [Cavia porcellus]